MKPKSSAAVLRGSPALALQAFLPYRLSVLAAAVSDGLARRYSRRFGVGVAEWRVIATLGECRAMTAGDIGRHARMGKVKVSRAAAALEEAKLIVRRASDRDLRESILTLSRKGERVYGAIAPLALDYAGRLTEALSADEAKALDAAIDKLMARADELATDVA